MCRLKTNPILWLLTCASAVLPAQAISSDGFLDTKNAEEQKAKLSHQVSTSAAALDNFNLSQSSFKIADPVFNETKTEADMKKSVRSGDIDKNERKKAKELLELSNSKKMVRPGNAPCLTWLPVEQNPTAVILCVHGLGLHNGTYADFGERMAAAGYATYAIDVRGFGSFMEAKGRENVDFDGCLKDIESTLKVLHRANPGLPVFILGESMGGAIALRATAIYPQLVDGLISSVPANDRFKQNQTRLDVALHLLENPNKPFNIGKGIISQATDKEDLREVWSKDPLNKLNLSANELLQFQHFMNQNHKCAKLIQNTPVLFVQGCKDKLVRPVGTVELFDELGTKDRELALIANGEHLIFEENQFTDQAINKVCNWLNAHVASLAKGDDKK